MDDAAARIDPRLLVPMDLFTDTEPVVIDLVYADAGHAENIFGIAAYAAGARLSLHADLARIVVSAARRLYAAQGWRLCLKDGLRVVEAQRRLIDTDIVRANPHWLETPRLLSGPGQGAHPRGMAIDLAPLDRTGRPLDMGTVFDAMIPESARAHEGYSTTVQSHRAALEQAMVESAAAIGLPLLPLASEWWDYRLPPAVTGPYAPFHDADLPAPLRMMAPGDGGADETARLAALAKSISASL